MLLELSQLTQGRLSHEPTELKTTASGAIALKSKRQQLCKDVDLLDFRICDKQTSYNLTVDKSHWHAFVDQIQCNIYLALSDILCS